MFLSLIHSFSLLVLHILWHKVCEIFVLCSSSRASRSLSQGHSSAQHEKMLCETWCTEVNCAHLFSPFFVCFSSTTPSPQPPATTTTVSQVCSIKTVLPYITSVTCISPLSSFSNYRSEFVYFELPHPQLY